MPAGIFVNSTISLEGVTNWFVRKNSQDLDKMALGCFDWDPFAAMIGKNTAMVRQDVPAMMELLFDQLKTPSLDPTKMYKIKPKIIKSPK